MESVQSLFAHSPILAIFLCVALGYAIGNSTQLNLSWRYLHLEGSNDQIPEKYLQH